MATTYDPIYDDPNAEYVNDEPIGGTGYEPAVNRPGFLYTGSVAGEAPAREAWNAGWQEGQPDTLDRGGNAYARQAALTYDAIKAQADAQAQIEASYRDAKTAGDIRATEAAAEYNRRDATRRAIAAGVQPGLAVAMNWVGKNDRGTGPIVKALTPNTTNNSGKTIRNIGGVAVEFDPNAGTVTELFRPHKEGLSQVERIQLQEAMASKRAAEQALGDPKKAIYKDRWNQTIAENNAIIDRILGKTEQGAPTAQSAPASQEIIRVTKDGRRVVYDAVTKQPLRYGN